MDAISVDAGSVVLGARSWPGGTGRPVLLVHGLSSNARLWDEVGAALDASGHPVVAVDLRGHGSSASAAAGTSDPTRQGAADLAAVCAGLGWSEAAVAGQSWGGNVVLQLAADRPDLVHDLTLVDGGWLHLSDRFATIDDAWAVLAPPRFDGLTAAALRVRLRSSHPAWSDAAVEATAANLEQHVDGTVTPWLTRERHREIVASMLAHRPRELYPLVRCPVLLMVAGTTGPLVTEAAAALKDAEVVEFPGGDHDLHAQQPGRVAELIAGLAR